MKETASSADGIRIVYDVVGEGTPPIVFVHGWSCDRSYWRHQVSAFRNRTVVAIDLAGHGESGAGRDSWTMAAFGQDVVAVIERLDLEHAILVGHSMGGDVITEAALALGSRVRGLVWVDTYPSLGRPDDPAEVEAFAAPFLIDFAGQTDAFVRGMFPPSADPALVDWIATDMASAPPQIAVDALKHAIGNEGPAIAALAKLSVPLVEINADYEPIDEASLRKHGITPVLMTTVGHFVMLEDPDQFNRVLADVIDSFA